MPTPKKGPRLASSPAHERLMLANMATSLFQHGRITTTLPKAKRLRPLAERLITFAKRGDLHSRRRVMRVIRNKSVVHVLFTQIAEQMEQREGGYTRIVKIAPRRRLSSRKLRPPPRSPPLPRLRSRRPPPLKLRLRRPPRPLPRRPPTRPSETRLIDIDRGWEP